MHDGKGKSFLLITNRDHMLVKLEKKFEITYYQNKYKLKDTKSHKAGALKEPISSTD
jgi:hypothetical protein